LVLKKFEFIKFFLLLFKMFFYTI